MQPPAAAKRKSISKGHPPPHCMNCSRTLPLDVMRFRIVREIPSDFHSMRFEVQVRGYLCSKCAGVSEAVWAANKAGNS